jgi:tripartite-type tricarboxylate transporter receptor subunit TctC
MDALMSTQTSTFNYAWEVFVQSVSRFLKMGLATAGLVIASVSNAQGWPSKPVRLINPFPAGGGTDTFARPLSAQLTKQTGQQFIVENIGGAGGTVGAAQAARAAPDGYTFLIGAVHHTIAPSIYPKLSYDIEKDFVPVTLLAIMPFVIAAQPNKLPQVKTVKDLVDYAKANPGKLNFGSPGSGTSQHLTGELFKPINCRSSPKSPSFRRTSTTRREWLSSRHAHLTARTLNSALRS